MKEPMSGVEMYDLLRRIRAARRAQSSRTRRMSKAGLARRAAIRAVLRWAEHEIDEAIGYVDADERWRLNVIGRGVREAGHTLGAMNAPCANDLITAGQRLWDERPQRELERPDPDERPIGRRTDGIPSNW